MTIFDHIVENLDDPGIQDFCTKQLLGTLLPSTKTCLMFEDTGTMVCCTGTRIDVQNGNNDLVRLYYLVMRREYGA